MEPTDFNALAFDQNSTRDPLQKHYISREGSRKRGLEIEFDPTRHREWVTGFRKRKAERQSAARKSLEIRAKEERLTDRKKRFEEKKKNLNLPNDYGVGDLNEEEHAAPEKIASMTHHRQAGVTTVVTTSAIAFDSDDMQDEEHSGSGSEDDRHEPLAVLAPATDSRTPKNVCSLSQKMILYLSVFSVTPKGMAAPLSRYSPDLVSQAGCAPIMQMGAAANPVDHKGRSSKKRQSSADRLAKLKTNQGKSKPRGPRAPRKSKAGKGKPGKGKRS